MDVIEELEALLGGPVAECYEPECACLEWMAPAMLEHGESYSECERVYQPGAPNECIENTRKLAALTGFQAVRGYARGSDGLFYHHAWCYDAYTDTIIETTTMEFSPSEYFGAWYDFD